MATGDCKTSDNVLARVFLSVAFAVSVFSPVDAEALEIERKPPVKISDVDIKKALEEFIKVCRPGSYWKDLTDIKIEAFQEYAPHRLAKGWKTTLHLSAKVPEYPERIPTVTPGAKGILMTGHTLHYDLGGGTSPGFFAGKDAAKWICGMHETMGTGADAFVPAPSLSFLR